MRKRLSLIAVGLAAVVIPSLLPIATAPAQEPTPTPPPPTWTPGPPSTKTPIPTVTLRASSPRSAPVGGFIELSVRFPQAWPWTEVQWYELWTTVQWRDAWDDWHDVEGWQGGLDEAVIDEGKGVVGKKVWWVARPDQGKGPFRWSVYQSQGGKLLAVSEPFYLPYLDGKTVNVVVSPSP